MRDSHAGQLGVVHVLAGTRARLRADVLAGNAGQGNPTGLGTRLAVRWPGEAISAGLRLVVIAEDGRLLGGKGEGATALAGCTSTVYTGLQASRALAPAGWQLYGQAQLGVSRYTADGAALIGDSSPIATSRAGAGLHCPLGLAPGDRLALGVIQPLRVESGALRLELPRRAYYDGSTGYATENGRPYAQRARAQPGGPVPDARAGRRRPAEPGREPEPPARPSPRGRAGLGRRAALPGGVLAAAAGSGR